MTQQPQNDKELIGESSKPNYSRFVVTSTQRNEITKLNIYQERFIVANTESSSHRSESTLIVGDMETGLLSEGKIFSYQLS